jgi:hypothetical protein
MGGRSGQSIGGGKNQNNQSSDLDNVKTFSVKDIYRAPTVRVFATSSFAPVNVTENNALEKTIEIYTLKGFNVNRFIRDNNLDNEDKAFIKNLDKALDALPVENQQKLYRAARLSNKEINKLAKGSEIQFTGYTSTTKSKSIADALLLNKIQGKSPVLFEVVSHKKGKSVENISIFPEEKEVLFKRNSKWQIVDIKLGNKNGDNFYNIKIKEK